MKKYWNFIKEEYYNYLKKVCAPLSPGRALFIILIGGTIFLVLFWSIVFYFLWKSEEIEPVNDVKIEWVFKEQETGHEGESIENINIESYGNDE